VPDRNGEESNFSGAGEELLEKVEASKDFDGRAGLLAWSISEAAIQVDGHRGPMFGASRYDWVLEFDIKGLFDNINHELLLRAVRRHITCKWALLYIERWLTAPMVQEDGTIAERHQGTPQGGVVSPVLANVFLHYAFDLWMKRTHPNLLWCRYADDGLVHCRSGQEAQALKSELQARLAECQLELHP